MSQAQPKDLNEMREWAGLLLAENDLDKEGRVDGGLYSYIDNGVVIRDQAGTVIRTFYDWPAIVTYIEMVHDLDEQGITNAALVSDEDYTARLERLRNLGAASEKPERPTCEICGNLMYPCEGCAKGEEAGPRAGEVRFTYCAVCDACADCHYHASPVKGRTTLPHLELWQDGDEWKATLDGKVITLYEVHTFLARVMPVPVIMTFAPDMDEGQRATQVAEFLGKLRESRNKGTIVPDGAKIEAVWPAYEYLDFGEFMRSEEGKAALHRYVNADTEDATSLDRLLNDVWSAARKEKSTSQDVVSEGT